MLPNNADTVSVESREPQRNFWGDAKTFVWNHRYRLGLLMLARATQFVGNMMAQASLSKDDNAAEASAYAVYHETVAISTGAVLLGLSVALGIQRGHIKERNQSDQDVEHANIAETLVASAATYVMAVGVTAPFMYFSQPILRLSLPSEVADTAADMTWQTYTHGVTALTMLEIVLTSVLLPFRYDVTNVVAQSVRLVFIVLMGQLYVDSESDPDVRFDKFTMMLALSYVISSIITLTSVASIGSRDEKEQPSIKGTVTWKEFREFNLDVFYQQMWFQFKVGFGIALDFAPALLADYLIINWLAPIAGEDVLEASNGIQTFKVITLLQGNAFFNQIMRKVGGMMGGLEQGFSIDDMQYQLRLIEKTFRVLSLLVGIFMMILTMSLSASGVLADMFAENNSVLNSVVVIFLSQLGATFQIINDGSVAILTAVQKLTFKAYASFIAYALSVFLAYGFVEAGAGVYGLFGAGVLAHGAYTAGLIAYFSDQLFCGVGLYLKELLQDVYDDFEKKAIEEDPGVHQETTLTTTEADIVSTDDTGVAVHPVVTGQGTFTLHKVDADEHRAIVGFLL